MVRAQRSASSTAASVTSLGASYASTTRRTVSTIPKNGNAPAVNAATACSLAALNTAGCSADAVTASRAKLTAGNASASSGAKSQVDATVQSIAGAASARRSGHDKPKAIGKRISGGETWARMEPS